MYTDLIVCDCTCSVRFDKSDVIEDLVDKEEITEEEADGYEPTNEQIRAYAWSLIENDEGEYGDVVIT